VTPTGTATGHRSRLSNLSSRQLLSAGIELNEQLICPCFRMLGCLRALAYIDNGRDVISHKGTPRLCCRSVPIEVLSSGVPKEPSSAGNLRQQGGGMSVMDRRDFMKSVSAAVGTAGKGV
jgi:hypothetical protein